MGVSSQNINKGTVVSDKGTVATVGVFDGVHRGHLHLLQQAAACGDRLIVVTFNRHPLQLVRPERAPRWLTPPPVRNTLLASVPDVDEVVQLDFDERLRRLTAADFMAFLRHRYGVETLVMGYDHHLGSDRSDDSAHYERAARQAGVRLLRARPLLVVYEGARIAASSSKIRQALSEGDMTAAISLLGRYYSVGGEVVHGRGQGHLLGFPTANIHIAPNRVIPAPGVYAAYATVGGKNLPAMVNIGVNPTLTDGSHLTVEAHILGHDADMYGAYLPLEFVERIRSERRFSGMEELKKQLDADRISVEKSLQNRQ